MELEDLETGMVVEIETELYMTMIVDGTAIFVNKNNWMSEEHYYEDLKHKLDSDWDIKKVYHKVSNNLLRECVWGQEGHKVLWSNQDEVFEEIAELKARIKKLEKRL
tara:strand:+ start:231 stop:551 length:321 start_codon:yes stop_codon:yes gene_type:complete